MASSLICGRNLIVQIPTIFLDLPGIPFWLNTRYSPAFRSPALSLSRLRSEMKNGVSSRASLGDLPTELTKFVPLNSEDPKYGPPALLLLGFQLEEAPAIQQLLKELDGEFLQVIFGTEEMMISGSLWDAVNTKQSILEPSMVASASPRICFMSGLTGEEMMMFIDAFPETGLETPVFAAMVPNSAEKPLKEVIEEIMGDHEMLSDKSEAV